MSEVTRASDQVLTTLFRALAVLRLVVMAYAVAKNVGRMDAFAHPGAAWVVVVVIVVWTALMTWVYDDPARRRLPWFGADLAVAIVLVLSTPYIQSQEMIDRHASHMPTFWVMAAVLAWAVGRGWVEGLIAAALVSIADVSVKVSVNGPTWGNIFLLFLGAGMVGYTVSLLKEAVELRAAADRTAAVAQERARLARVVHDGTLQVLALVQRRGRELGGEFAELGLLAGEQEVALRSLVQGDPVGSGTGGGSASTPASMSTSSSSATHVAAPSAIDLADLLRRLGTSRVTVSVPGGSVVVPVTVGEEVLAVVHACLDNVSRHVGESAPAWVLLEDLGDRVLVSVRDEGPGIAPGRLEEAADDGRLGVRESICGRIADLGGSATVETGPGRGTEWELTVPIGGAS